MLKWEEGGGKLGLGEIPVLYLMIMYVLFQVTHEDIHILFILLYIVCMYIYIHMICICDMHVPTYSTCISHHTFHTPILYYIFFLLLVITFSL